jgi:hypothetical protein
MVGRDRNFCVDAGKEVNSGMSCRFGSLRNPPHSTLCCSAKAPEWSVAQRASASEMRSGLDSKVVRSLREPSTSMDMNAMTWSERCLPTPGRSILDGMPRASNSSLGPTPLRRRILGVSKVPAQSMTSLLACAVSRR